MSNATIEVNKKKSFLDQDGDRSNKQATYLCSKLMNIELPEQLQEFFKSDLPKSIFGESLACMLVNKQDLRVLGCLSIGPTRAMTDIWCRDNLKRFCKDASSDRRILARGLGNPNWITLTHGFSLKYENKGSIVSLSSAVVGRDFPTWRLIKLLLPYIFSAQKSIYYLENMEANDCDKLSPREVEIMKWISMGKTNSEVAMILGVSAFTIKNHVANILAKLKVSNRVQAIGRAEAHGYLR